jgi:hypothetical protein
VTFETADWWYRTPGGDLYGPYDTAQLRQFAIDGRIDVMGSIRRGENADWLDPREVLAQLGITSEPAGMSPPIVRSPPKTGVTPLSSLSRITYVLTGLLPFLLVSVAGVHNLMAGRIGAGVTQLVASLVGVWGLGCVSLVSGGAAICLSVLIWIGLLVWVIIDVTTIRTDGSGRLFRA